MSLVSELMMKCNEALGVKVFKITDPKIIKNLKTILNNFDSGSFRYNVFEKEIISLVDDVVKNLNNVDSKVLDEIYDKLSRLADNGRYSSERTRDDMHFLGDTLEDIKLAYLGKVGSSVKFSESKGVIRSSSKMIRVTDRKVKGELENILDNFDSGRASYNPVEREIIGYIEELVSNLDSVDSKVIEAIDHNLDVLASDGKYTNSLVRDDMHLLAQIIDDIKKDYGLVNFKR